MSGWATERRTLESWFHGKWSALAGPWSMSTVPVEFEGQVFDTPADGGPYVSMTVIGAESGTQVSLGTPALNRYVGIVQFIISCPIGKSLGPNEMVRQIADALDTLWKSKRLAMYDTASPPNYLGRIRCRVPGLHMLGTVDGRFVGALSIPYLRDEIAPIPDAE